MRYTAKMIQWLEQKAHGKRFKELSKLFNVRFNAETSASQLKCICGYYGIKTEYDWNKSILLPIGTERVFYRKTGATYVKTSHVQSGNGHWPTGTWIPKQNLIWERKHGKIPKNHVIIFLDGNKKNFRISNLLLVSRKIFFYMTTRNLLTNNADMTKINYAIAKSNLSVVDAIKRLTKVKRFDRRRSRRWRVEA